MNKPKLHTVANTAYKQIIPAAEGWRAVYREDGGTFEAPVICWALAEEESHDVNGRGAIVHREPPAPFVIGLVAMGGEAALCDAEAKNFIRYLGPGQKLAEDGEGVVSQ